MSEKAPSAAPEEAPDAHAAEVDQDDGAGRRAGGGGAGRGCLPVLLGTFLLLVGAFIGTRLAQRFPSADSSPTTAPSGSTTAPVDARAALAEADRLPVKLHYLVLCADVEVVGTRLNIYGAMAELRPRALPVDGEMMVALAISAANRDRRVAIRGMYADGTPFIEQPLELDPEDPQRAQSIAIPVRIKLTTADPLTFDVITDDGLLIARRLVNVRLQPTTRPEAFGPRRQQ